MYACSFFVFFQISNNYIYEEFVDVVLTLSTQLHVEAICKISPDNSCLCFFLTNSFTYVAAFWCLLQDHGARCIFSHSHFFTFVGRIIFGPDIFSPKFDCFSGCFFVVSRDFNFLPHYFMYSLPSLRLFCRSLVNVSVVKCMFL